MSRRIASTHILVTLSQHLNVMASHPPALVEVSMAEITTFSDKSTKFSTKNDTVSKESLISEDWKCKCGSTPVLVSRDGTTGIDLERVVCPKCGVILSWEKSD